jgi:hypothetical protein
MSMGTELAKCMSTYEINAFLVDRTVSSSKRKNARPSDREAEGVDAHSLDSLNILLVLI